MSLLGSLIGPATQLLDKVIEDKDEKNRIAFELSTLAERHAQELAKGRFNFVAGWRPCIGWVCALGLFYNTILSNILGIWVEVPEIDTTLLVPVMMGMLGLGAIRS